ncbi:NAD(P)-binding domain-containing protein [Azospirillum ramasamyi]|uniref:NAD(P)-dependent oxidoreductase n=1 Tax=Azospirillum ramasamyi TaxID=682998 RepID=A0A2U9SA22_9PROT|nr:NAD(P)-binding domain-containing protein [Azospirillum ramasamyi]AWU95767.1 NAD(P)-dependent oxidoreductase [Azospirillum ramasamyi]
MDIGFIGGGEVADAIMDRLREVGHRLHHHSHSHSHAHSYDHARGPLRALAERCDVVMMLLPDSRTVERALFADAGLASALPGVGLLIDLSPLPPESAAANAARIADLGGQLVDAPVSRGAKGYRIDLGGSDAACAWAESVLRVFTSTVERAGGPGAGQRARLARSADRTAGRTAGRTDDDPDGLHRLLRLMAFDEADCALSAG